MIRPSGGTFPSLRRLAAGALLGSAVFAGCSSLPPSPVTEPPESTEPESKSQARPPFWAGRPDEGTPIRPLDPPPAPEIPNPIDRLGLPVGRISVTGTKTIGWIPVSLTREGEVKRESPDHLSLASLFDFWVPFYGEVRIDFHLDVWAYGVPDEIGIEIRNGDVYHRYIVGVISELPDGGKLIKGKYGEERFMFTPEEDGSTRLAVEGMREMEGVGIVITPLPPEDPAAAAAMPAPEASPL